MSNTGPLLADILESVRSGSWGSDVATGERPIPVRVVRNGDISEDRRILFENIPKRWVSERELDNSRVTDRDTLIVGSGYIGKSARLRGGGMVFEEPIIASNFIRIITPDNRTDPGWLFWLLGLESAINFMKRVSAGTSLQNLPTSFFREYKIPFYPPIERQRHVANILDSVDEAIDTIENILTKTKQLRDALLQELLNPDGNTYPYGKEGICGDISSNRRVIRLRDGAEIGSGKSPQYAENDLGQFDVVGSNGKIGSTDRVNFYSGIAVGRVGASGSVHQIKRPVWLSDNVLFVKPNPSIWNESFLYHTLRIARLPDLASQTAQPLLTQTELGAVFLPAPSLKEQNNIAVILDSVDDTVEQTGNIITTTEQLRAALLNELLVRRE